MRDEPRRGDRRRRGAPSGCASADLRYAGPELGHRGRLARATARRAPSVAGSSRASRTSTSGSTASAHEEGSPVEIRALRLAVARARSARDDVQRDARAAAPTPRGTRRLPTSAHGPVDAADARRAPRRRPERRAAGRAAPDRRVRHDGRRPAGLERAPRARTARCPHATDVAKGRRDVDYADAIVAGDRRQRASRRSPTRWRPPSSAPPTRPSCAT